MKNNNIKEGENLNDFLKIITEAKQKSSTYINLSAAEIDRFRICNIPFNKEIQDHYIHGSFFDYFNKKRTNPISKIYKKAVELGHNHVKSTTNFEYCDFRTSSALHALQICVLALTNKNDIVFYTERKNGGHSSYYEIITKLGRTPIPINFNEMWESEIINNTEPKLIILGFSEILTDSIQCESFRRYYKSMPIILDYAQLSGFIFAGKTNSNHIYDNEIIIGSTHKTLPLSPAGFILTNNKEYFKKIDGLIFPIFIRSVNVLNQFSLFLGMFIFSRLADSFLNRINCIRDKLSGLLISNDIEVINHPYLKNSSHQIWIKTGNDKTVDLLYNLNIITDKKILPYNIGNGIRLGVQQLAADNVGEDFLEKISKSIASAIRGERESTKYYRSKTIANSIWVLENELLKSYGIEI